MNLVTTATERFFALTLAAVLCALAIAFFGMTPWLIGIVVLVVLAILLVVYHFDYLHPTVAFVMPWLGIVGFSMIPISQNARQLAPDTYELVLGVILVWMLFTVGAPIRVAANAISRVPTTQPAPPLKNIHLLTVGFVLLYLLAGLNIAVSGYIPLFELFLTGDSLYAEFGIPSVYGFFFAYANALGCLAFYVYLRSKKRKPLLFFLSVVAIHLLFVTRQHLLTLLIEAFIIRCFTIAPISRAKLAVLAVAGLVALNFLGELRSGDIRETIHIADEYKWIPGAAAWLYAYSYFNALNLENTMAVSDAPYFDGTMLQTILPSILRPELTHAAIFEIPDLNILSYIYPVYLDIGVYGVLAFTALVGWITAVVHKRALTQRRFGAISAYSFFYYSAIMSFFTPFWLYLPVVFQLVFFWMFEGIFFRRRRYPTQCIASHQESRPENPSDKNQVASP
jgi:oligosaccharide repeat unit polymerase